MKRIFIALSLLTILFLNSAGQETFSELKEIVMTYPHLSSAEKAKYDSLFMEIVKDHKTEQVISICGVNFGDSKDKILPILERKYGKPILGSSEDNIIVFEDVLYGGFGFNKASFYFQSDGLKSYLNCVILIKHASDLGKAYEIQQELFEKLNPKYHLSEDIDSNGFKEYSGGISPLWNGHWYQLLAAVLLNINGEVGKRAVSIKILENTPETASVLGYKYNVGIWYGPFNYVKEEF